jgi:potassium-dependent mechanosensitive channel
MALQQELQKIDFDFDTPLFDLAGATITPTSLIVFAVVVLFFYAASRLARRGLREVILRRFARDRGSAEAVGRLAEYVILFIGLATAFRAIGIKMSALAAAGAVFAVAIGFAMQNIMQNFVSGIILLMERSIKPGDVLEVDGEIIQVKETGIRSTIAQTLDLEDLIIPNSILVQSTVKNFTLKDSRYRLGATVGVGYGSDMQRGMEVLARAAEGLPGRLTTIPPTVQMTEFAASSVNFRVHVFVDQPWRRNQYLSDLNQAIWFALKDAGIVIAFPQVDIHLDAEAIATLAAARHPA